jgi:hypothetical protein
LAAAQQTAIAIIAALFLAIALPRGVFYRVVSLLAPRKRERENRDRRRQRKNFSKIKLFYLFHLASLLA